MGNRFLSDALPRLVDGWMEEEAGRGGFVKWWLYTERFISVLAVNLITHGQGHGGLLASLKELST